MHFFKPADEDSLKTIIEESPAKSAPTTFNRPPLEMIREESLYNETLDKNKTSEVSFKVTPLSYKRKFYESNISHVKKGKFDELEKTPAGREYKNGRTNWMNKRTPNSRTSTNKSFKVPSLSLQDFIKQSRETKQ